MIRIYLDSNIYRFIKKDNTDLYQKLGKDLTKYGDRLIYYYSHAHLLDLKRDTTNMKYEDLRFMEKFVGTNYLTLEWKESFVSPQIATPREAFEGLGEEKPFTDYFKFDELFSNDLIENTPELEEVKLKWKELLSMPMNLGLASNISNHSENEKKAWQNLIPNIKDEYTFLEWIEQFSKIYEKLYNDPKTYKELRKNSIDNLQLANKYHIDIEKINFNEDLKNTPIQLSFLEFVQKSMEHSENNEQKEFNFFITAYSSLNILGIDNESNKKAKFANTMNDAQHSYYSAHCDYLVSDDEGLLVKSKVLFKLLEIETKVLTVEEFSKQIPIIAGLNDISLEGYLRLLKYDLSKGLIIETKPSFRYNRTYVTIKPIQNHFSYFNQFDRIKDENEGDIIVFYRKIKNYSKFVSYKEFEAVTNKVVKLFGTDIRFKDYYSDKDTKEIQNGNWDGRAWDIGKFRFVLEINEGTRSFNFAVILPTRNK